MPSAVPAYCGTYRDITEALVERISRERAERGAGFVEALEEPIEILIPSRGVADGIVAALTRLFPQGVAGIRLHTLDSLALRILNRAGRYPRIATAADRRLAILGAASQMRDSRLNTPGMAVMLERSYRDVRDSGVTLPSFRRWPSEVIDCWRRYESAMSRCGALDPADAIHQAVELLTQDSDLPTQIVFGFYDMTGIQEILLRALHRAGKVDSIYLPVNPDDPRYAFAHRHISVLECGGLAAAFSCLEKAAARPPHSICRYQTPAEEACETFREVRELIDSGCDPRRIGVVARDLDAQALAALHRAAGEFDIPLSAPQARPLASHPFGRTVRLLLQVRELRFPRAMVIELAASPLRRDFWGFPFHAERLDSATRRAEIAGGPSTWVKAILPRVETEQPHDLEHVTNYIRALDRLERFTEPITTQRRAARWSETLEAIADALFVETEDDLLALAALAGIAEVCRRADPAGVFFDVAAILHLIDTSNPLPAERKNEERGARSEERPTALAPRSSLLAPSVWVGDVMKARGRTFAHLFVLGVRDGAFPQARSEDPLLPNSDRKLAGVREIGDGRDEERLLFQLLIDSAQTQIHFSYPSSDGIRRVFYPSPFLKSPSLPLTGTRSEERRAKSEEQTTDPRSSLLAPRSSLLAPRSSLSPRTRAEQRLAGLFDPGAALTPSLARKLELVRLAGTRSRFDGYVSLDEVLQRTLEEELALISPTQLEYYGQCPQRFLFTALLGIGEVEDPEYELQISLRKKGGLDHRILESFYRTVTEADFSAVSTGGLSPALQKRLDETIAEEFKHHEMDYPAPNQMLREIEQKLTRKFLSDFVREDLRDLVESGFRPEHFEYQFGPGRGERQPDHDAVTLRFGSRSVTLRGKIDRVDRNRATGAVRVVDYKSGKGVKYKDLADLIESGRALQLAFYALAACEIFHVPPRQMHAAIKPLRRGEADLRFSFALGDLEEKLAETFHRFAESMTTGHFPAFPRQHCDYCAVNRWCRAKNDPQERLVLGKYDSALELLSNDPSPLAPLPGGERGV